MDHKYNRTEIEKDFKFVRKVSWLMDEKFRFPGTKFRFGLDPILNLVPFAGDALGFIISMLLVAIISKNGASSKVIVKMTLNVILDAVLGGIPLFGKLIDFGFKANQRNIRLLEKHYFEDKNQGSAAGILIAILVFVLLFFCFILFLIWKITTWIWEISGLDSLF